MLLAVHRDIDAVDTVAHAEGAAELNLIFETFFPYECLKLLDNLTRTLEMAGTTNSDNNFHVNRTPFHSYFISWLQPGFYPSAPN